MSDRQTAVSRSVVYETARCVHCDDEVFIDSDHENVDDLPEGRPLVIGGGDHLSVDKTDRTRLTKSHWAPRVIVKWFTDDGQSADLNRQYLCQSCAASLYES